MPQIIFRRIYIFSFNFTLLIFIFLFSGINFYFKTIHDTDLNPGMTNRFDGYLVMRKYETCDASVFAALADDSVEWWITDLNAPASYTTHKQGYYKNDVPNKKKTFTLGYA